jgi:hypothetical protein
MELRIAPMKNYNKDNNTRKCTSCMTWLTLEEFNSRIRMASPTTKDPSKKCKTLYYRSTCKKCSLKAIKIDKYSSKESRKIRYHKDPRKVMVTHAKKRAIAKGVPFDILYTDIVIPSLCPLLNIPLCVSHKKHSSNSPSLDRIIPELGYVKSNILIISHRANTAKQDLSINELELLTKNLKRVLNKEEELLEN